MTTKAAVQEKLISMLTDGKHGDALSREEALWLIESHKEFTDEELGKIINSAAVEPFRRLCSLIA